MGAETAMYDRLFYANVSLLETYKSIKNHTISICIFKNYIGDLISSPIGIKRSELEPIQNLSQSHITPHRNDVVKTFGSVNNE